jgi:hypothetical protein
MTAIQALLEITHSHIGHVISSNQVVLESVELLTKNDNYMSVATVDRKWRLLRADKELLHSVGLSIEEKENFGKHKMFRIEQLSIGGLFGTE